MMGKSDGERAFAVITGKLAPWWRPLKRIRQDLALAKTPGLVMRLPEKTCTVMVFRKLDDADACLMRLVWRGYPHGDYVHEARVDGGKVRVYGPIDGFPGEGS